MGQSSSQVNPSQVPGSARSFISKVMPWDSTPKLSNKRSRPANDEEEEETRKPKKLKHDEERPLKGRKPNKAVPQHRRGTAIKPQEIEVPGESQEAEENEDDEIVVATPASKKQRPRKHASAETISDTHPAGRKRKKAKTLDEQSVGNEGVVNEHEASVHDDGVVISANGQPGPKRKGRKKKSITAKSSRQEQNQAEVIPETQPPPPEVHSDGVSISEVGRPGPKRKKRTKLAATDSQPGQSQNDDLQSENGTPTGQAAGEDQSGDRFTQNRRSRTKAVKDRTPTNGVGSEPRSASRLPTPSEEEDDVIDQVYDPNGEDSEHDEDNDASIFQKPADPPTAKPKPNKKKQKPASTATHKDPLTEPGPRQAVAEDADTRPVSMKRFQTAERGTLTGPWTAKEHELADKIFHDFCRHNNIHGAVLKDQTTKWGSLGPLKTQLYEAFPKRSLELIRKHMQRRFSPYEKGQWSEEETQRLKDAYAKHPDQWADIAKEVERGPQACRDRWVNFMKYEDTMDRGAWGITEEAKLVKIVETAVALIVEMTDDLEVRNDRPKAEAMLNWVDVASKMDGKRNAKRCAEKWRLLKRRSNKPNAQQNTGTPQNDEQQPSRKKRDIERQYVKMKPGDVHAMLFDFVHVINATPAATTYHHDSTFWSIIGAKQDDFKFIKNVPLVRHVYLNALVTYNCKRAREGNHFGKKVVEIIRKMQKLAEKGKLNLDDRYFGVVEDVKVAHTKTPKKKGLSEDVVQSSDDEAEAAPTATRADDAIDAGDDIAAQETPPEQVAGAEEEDELEDEQSEAEDGESVDLVQEVADEYQDAQSLRSETPHLTPAEFMEKCKQTGKKQHRAFLEGYGR